MDVAAAEFDVLSSAAAAIFKRLRGLATITTSTTAIAVDGESVSDPGAADIVVQGEIRCETLSVYNLYIFVI